MSKRNRKLTTAPANIFIAEATAAPEYSIRNDSSRAHSGGDWDVVKRQASNQFELSIKADLLQDAAHFSAGAVLLDPRFGFLPVIIDANDCPIPVYQFVEGIDGAINYDDILVEFPTLTYAKVAGALAFLRKVSQFNTRNTDIDAIEDAEFESSQEFQDILAHSLQDTEATVVRASE